jgi:hypothetical protein
MSRGLGTEQRRVLAAVVRDTTRHWRRADIQRFVSAETRPRTDRQEPLDDKEFPDGTMSRALASLVKRGLLERHQLPGGLTWKVTQAGVEVASAFEPAAGINDLAKGAA